MRSIPLPDPPLTDGEIRLRPWERRDVPAVTAACQDPEIPRWTVVPRNSRSATRSTSWRAPGRTSLPGASSRWRSSTPTTACSARWPLELRLARPEGGDRLLDGAESRAAESARATRMLAVWAITALGLERIELLANPENEASQRLAERAGFTREGTCGATAPARRARTW